MSAFDLAFSFFGLILGLALVAVLSGLVRTTRDWQPSARHYYLTCALGLFVSLDLITYWSVLFASRDFLPGNTLSLYVGFFISGIYYWAASMVFPDQSQGPIDLDEHYFCVRRKVAVAVLSCNVALYAALSAALGRLAPPAQILELAVFAGLFLALILVRTKRANAIVLTLVIAAYLASAVFRSIG
jgi:hypothetical protein